jgi:hypothetical protein
MLDSILGTVKTGSSAVAKAASGTKAGAGLLTSTVVSGSAMHQGVLAVGHFFGATFKPWQAVNIAKGIGNFAKILGPLAVVFSVGMEIADSVQEKKREEKERNQRRDIISSFTEQADSVVKQFKEQFNQYKDQAIHGEQKKIKHIRDQRTGAIELTDKTAKELKLCVEDFKRLVAD